MAVDVYINFNGNCREAVEFYAEVFGTEKPKIMTYGDVPPDTEHSLPEGSEDLVMHARLSLSISSRDLDEVKSLFHKLKEGGTVGMELQETFWSKCYGNLTDKFGIEWQVNHESDDIKM